MMYNKSLPDYPCLKHVKAVSVFSLHLSFITASSCSVDLRERQAHYTGTERHRFQLRWHSNHVQSDVQRACGNTTQCQLHCMCHLKGQSELSASEKHDLTCINLHDFLGLTYCPHCNFYTPGTRLPLWHQRVEEGDPGIGNRNEDNIFVFQLTWE